MENLDNLIDELQTIQDDVMDENEDEIATPVIFVANGKHYQADDINRGDDNVFIQLVGVDIV